jgi:hypothetical protein
MNILTIILFFLFGVFIIGSNVLTGYFCYLIGCKQAGEKPVKLIKPKVKLTVNRYNEEGQEIDELGTVLDG